MLGGWENLVLQVLDSIPTDEHSMPMVLSVALHVLLNTSHALHQRWLHFTELIPVSWTSGRESTVKVGSNREEHWGSLSLF